MDVAIKKVVTTLVTDVGSTVLINIHFVMLAYIANVRPLLLRAGIKTGTRAPINGSKR